MNTLRPNTPKRRKQKNRVTIIVAIVAEGKIVLASDSQTTYGTSKLCNAEKISLIPFKPNEDCDGGDGLSEVLIAQSGLAELSSRVVEIFKDKAGQQQIDGPFAVANVAEQSVRELRQHLSSLYDGQNFSQDEWQRYFRDENAFELMTANWFQERPRISTINIEWCVAAPISSYYHAIGCGSSLGNYLLSELATPNMHWKSATLTALYVVEKVKQYDAFCGGPARLGWVDKHFGARIFDPEEVGAIVQKVSDIDEATKSERNRQIQRMLNETGQQAVPDDKKQ